MSIAATIREKLMIALRPTRLDVINESYLHAGHRSTDPRAGELARDKMPDHAQSYRACFYTILNDVRLQEMSRLLLLLPAHRAR